MSDIPKVDDGGVKKTKRKVKEVGSRYMTQIVEKRRETLSNLNPAPSTSSGSNSLVSTPNRDNSSSSSLAKQQKTLTPSSIEKKLNLNQSLMFSRRTSSLLKTSTSLTSRPSFGVNSRKLSIASTLPSSRLSLANTLNKPLGRTSVYTKLPDKRRETIAQSETLKRVSTSEKIVSASQEPTQNHLSIMELQTRLLQSHFLNMKSQKCFEEQKQSSEKSLLSMFSLVRSNQEEMSSRERELRTKLSLLEVIHSSKHHIEYFEKVEKTMSDFMDRYSNLMEGLKDCSSHLSTINIYSTKQDEILESVIESKQKVQSTIEKTQKMDGIMNQVELVSVSTLEAIQLFKECSLLYKELIELESQERYHKISSIQLPCFYKNPKV